MLSPVNIVIKEGEHVTEMKDLHALLSKLTGHDEMKFMMAMDQLVRSLQRLATENHDMDRQEL